MTDRDLAGVLRALPRSVSPTRGRRAAKSPRPGSGPWPVAPALVPVVAVWDLDARGTLASCRPFDDHAAVTTLTEAGASEPLAMAVVDLARQAGTDAAGELVTRADFDSGMTRLGVALATLRVAAEGAW